MREGRTYLAHKAVQAVDECPAGGAGRTPEQAGANRVGRCRADGARGWFSKGASHRAGNSGGSLRSQEAQLSVVLGWKTSRMRWTVRQAKPLAFQRDTPPSHPSAGGGARRASARGTRTPVWPTWSFPMLGLWRRPRRLPHEAAHACVGPRVAGARALRRPVRTDYRAGTPWLPPTASRRRCGGGPVAPFPASRARSGRGPEDVGARDLRDRALPEPREHEPLQARGPVLVHHLLPISSSNRKSYPSDGPPSLLRPFRVGLRHGARRPSSDSPDTRG